jgi:hypothetical protein
MVFEDEACMATVDPSQLATAILNLASTPATRCPMAEVILETSMAFR